MPVTPENEAVVGSSEGFVLMRVGDAVASFEAQPPSLLAYIVVLRKDARSRARQSAAAAESELLYNMMGVLSIVGLWVCKMFKKKPRARERKRKSSGWMDVTSSLFRMSGI